jgi:hypothetical protein
MLIASCRAEEQVLWKAYNEVAKGALGLVVTHAALLIDMSLFGQVTEAAKFGYALVVIDEAHSLSRAASSAFSDKISLVSLAEEAADLVVALRTREGLNFRADLQESVLASANAYEAACQRLLGDAREHAGAVPQGSRVVSIGKDTAWYAAIPALRDALADVVAALVRAGNAQGGVAEGEANGFVTDLVKTDRPLQMLLDCMDWRATNQKTGLYVPQLSLTPLRRDPCLQVVPVKAQRIVSRLWESGVPSRGGNLGPMADAVVFTSATLVASEVGEAGYAPFRRAGWSYGIDDATSRVNEDLCDRFEPEMFGRPRFVFADPHAPYMTSRENGDTSLTLDGTSYLALAVEAAMARPDPRTGDCRQVIVTNSFEDVAAIYESLPEHVRPHVVARHRGQSLDSARREWRADRLAILVTPGAHEGLNEPGLVNHLHVYRLPFEPPKEIDGKRDHYWNCRVEMMIKLRQYIGRGVRGATDAPTFWITDVRIPPPDIVRKRDRRFAERKADAGFLNAFPSRWSRAMNNAEILPCPDALKGDRRRVQPYDEENAA